MLFHSVLLMTSGYEWMHTKFRLMVRKFYVLLQLWLFHSATSSCIFQTVCSRLPVCVFFSLSCFSFLLYRKIHIHICWAHKLEDQTIVCLYDLFKEIKKINKLILCKKNHRTLPECGLKIKDAQISRKKEANKLYTVEKN